MLGQFTLIRQSFPLYVSSANGLPYSRTFVSAGRNREGMAEGMANLQLDYLMMYYYSSKSGVEDKDSKTIRYLKKAAANVGCHQVRKHEFIGRVQTWLEESIEDIKTKHPDQEIIFGFAPGHLSSSPNGFMITDLHIDTLCTVRPKLLERVADVPKQATGGERNIDNHLKSIEVKEDLSGKIVCIMDDIWTSGCTLNACTELVREKGAKQVYTLTIGKTDSLDWED